MLAAIARTTVKKSRRVSRKVLSRALLTKLEDIFLCRYNFEDPHATYQDPSEQTLIPAITEALSRRGVSTDFSVQQPFKKSTDLLLSHSRELALSKTPFRCLYEPENSISRVILPKIANRDYFLGN